MHAAIHKGLPQTHQIVQYLTCTLVLSRNPVGPGVQLMENQLYILQVGQELMPL